MGECLTYLRESLFSGTLAPSLCTEESDLLNASIPSWPASSGASGACHFVLTARGPPGVRRDRQHCSGEGPCGDGDPAILPKCTQGWHLTPSGPLGLYLEGKKAERRIFEVHCCPCMHAQIFIASQNFLRI